MNNWRCNHEFTSSKGNRFVAGIVICDETYELLNSDEQDMFSATDEKVTSKKRIKELISESNSDINYGSRYMLLKLGLNPGFSLQKIYNCILPLKE